jgi:hypothetical protein
VVQHLAQISEALAKAVVNIATGKTLQIEVRNMVVFYLRICFINLFHSNSTGTAACGTGNINRVEESSSITLLEDQKKLFRFGFYRISKGNQNFPKYRQFVLHDETNKIKVLTVPS